MKQFNVYSHPVLGPQAVKQGFSWPAFFFTWIWAFVCKLWVPGSIMLVILSLSSCVSFGGSAGLVAVGEMVAEEEVETDSVEVTALESTALVSLVLFLLGGPVAYFVVGVAAGSRGNHWRDKQARQQGFSYLKTVPASSAEAALTQLPDLKQSSTKEGTT